MYYMHPSYRASIFGKNHAYYTESKFTHQMLFLQEIKTTIKQQDRNITVKVSKHIVSISHTRSLGYYRGRMLFA